MTDGYVRKTMMGRRNDRALLLYLVCACQCSYARGMRISLCTVVLNWEDVSASEGSQGDAAGRGYHPKGSVLPLRTDFKRVRAGFPEIVG